MQGGCGSTVGEYRTLQEECSRAFHSVNKEKKESKQEKGNKIHSLL